MGTTTVAAGVGDSGESWGADDSNHLIGTRLADRSSPTLGWRDDSCDAPVLVVALGATRERALTAR